jgi:hypothetical protein
MSRRALLLTLAVAIALLALSVLVGFRDYTQSVVVAHEQPINSTDTTAAPQYEKVVLHCPGPLASAANMGAYYPVNGRVVSPPRPSSFSGDVHARGRRLRRTGFEPI